MDGPELVLDARATLAEGPLWDAARGVLWWVDILDGDVHAFDPVAGTDRAIAVGSEVGCVAPMADGRLVAGTTDRIVALDPDSGERETLVTFGPAAVRLRCNDGRCDPAGRFWVGRMAFDGAAGHAGLLRLDPDGRLSTVLTGLAIPNGLGWSSDGRTLAFIDSARREVSRYPYDPASGALGTGGTLLSFESLDLPPEAVPDGMAVDVDDGLWVAVWGGGCVLHVSPDGAVLDRLLLPVSRPSSCAFGGPDLADLYVTTAREGLDPEREAREPQAGGLFRFRPGVRGRPADAFAWLGPGRPGDARSGSDARSKGSM
jgi:sugar lactone lactonase YvrE